MICARDGGGCETEDRGTKTLPRAPKWGVDLRLTSSSHGDLRSGRGRGRETRAEQAAEGGVVRPAQQAVNYRLTIHTPGRLTVPTTRRDVLRLGIAAAGLSVPAIAQAQAASAAAAAKPLPEATPQKLPRWRGFNLLNKFMADGQKPFEERDFADIAELGFDFVRLPLDYRCWTEPDKPGSLKEPVLKEIDQAVEFGKKHDVHVQINFHRAAGFTVAKPPEPKSIWSDQEILEVCASSGQRLPSGIKDDRTTRSASICSTNRTTKSKPRITGGWSSESPGRFDQSIRSG